jgi:hypothetical protein
MIEAVFFISSEDGFSRWRAKGIVRRTKAELAEALGVDEAEFKCQPDPVQLAEEQRRQQRARHSRIAKGIDFDPITGR